MSDLIRILGNKTLDSPKSISHTAKESQIVTRNATSAPPKQARTILQHLAQDPFVGYVAETEENYVIALRDSRPLAVPKGRASRETFPPVAQTAGERTMGLIAWMVFGLVPAGMGALILCPFVLKDAFNVLRRSKVQRERRLALFAVAAAIILGVIGEVFVLLLILHMIG